jgi:hypothetical protein
MHETVSEGNARRAAELYLARAVEAMAIAEAMCSHDAKAQSYGVAKLYLAMAVDELAKLSVRAIFAKAL